MRVSAKAFNKNSYPGLSGATEVCTKIAFIFDLHRIVTYMFIGVYVCVRARARKEPR